MPITGGMFGGFSLFLSLAPLLAQTPDGGLKIEVHLYNYSRVSPIIVSRAEVEAARIYGRAGVTMEWQTCPLSGEELLQNTTCELAAAPTRFILRLISDAMAQRFPLNRDIYGFALLSLDGGFGVVATVFADRVWKTALGKRSQDAFLGHVIAHELGHLLLDEAGHPAATGIMRNPWRAKELELISRGVMFFLPEQAERIRAQVLKRMKVV